MRNNKTKSHFLKVTLLLISPIILSKNTQNLNYRFIHKLLLKLLSIKLQKMLYYKSKLRLRFKRKNPNVLIFKSKQTLKMMKMKDNLLKSKVRRLKVKVNFCLLTSIFQSQTLKKVIIRTVLNNLWICHHWTILNNKNLQTKFSC